MVVAEVMMMAIGLEGFGSVGLLRSYFGVYLIDKGTLHASVVT